MIFDRTETFVIRGEAGRVYQACREPVSLSRIECVAVDDSTGGEGTQIASFNLRCKDLLEHKYRLTRDFNAVARRYWLDRGLIWHPCLDLNFVVRFLSSAVWTANVKTKVVADNEEQFRLLAAETRDRSRCGSFVEEDWQPGGYHWRRDVDGEDVVQWINWDRGVRTTTEHYGDGTSKVIKIERTGGVNG